MRRVRAGLRATRWLASTLLRCYPPEFRHRHRAAFLESAEHRWQRELAAGGRPARATLITGLLLCADTLGAAPASWRASGGGYRHGPRRFFEGASLMSRMHGTLSDLRLALRLMRRQPVTAALVVATLALGIGVSTAAFSALDRVVLRPLPFEDGDRMRYLAVEHRELGWAITPPAEAVAAWRQSGRAVTRVETYRDVGAVRLDNGPAERLSVTQISVGLPAMLGVRPLLGRMLTAADAAADAPDVVMVGEAFWRDALAADPDVVGRTLGLSTGVVTIVGVWPGAAHFNYRASPDLIRIVDRDREFSQGTWTSILGLLSPGATEDAARAELNGLAAATEQMRPDYHVAIVPPTGFVGDAYVVGLWLVFAGGLVLFVVAVVNAANLLLGRATTRDGEMGVRRALGGTSGRLVRLFAAESLMLTAAGIVVGLGVAAATTAAYAAWEPRGLIVDRGAWLDQRALLFGAIAAAVAMIAGTVAPAWRASAADIRDVVAASGGSRTTDGSSRVRAVLVAAQAALAVLLVAGAALTARSFVELASVDPGFDVDRLAMVSVSAPAARYPTSEERAAFLDRVRDSIAALPQVERMTETGAPPFQTSSGSGVLVFEGEPIPAQPVLVEVASQGIDEHFFDVFGTALVAGRGFLPSDGDDALIVNESLARAHGGVQAVLGRRLTFGLSPEARGRPVVGIAADVSANALSSDPTGTPQIYLPDFNRSSGFARFVLRVSGDPAAAVRDVRARVAALDSTVPLSEATTVRTLFDAQTAQHRFLAYLLGGLALFGVLFAIAGVYGVVALDVARRTREVGLRMALGATTARIARQQVRRGIRPVILGCAVGVLAALWAGPTMEAVLYRVSARDPLSVAAGVLLVVATAAAACLVPARRAARVDPAVSLRTE